MKKLIAFLLSMVLFIFPVTAFADGEQPIMGDVDGNGRITAADARAILRHSAKLPATGNFDPLCADTDANGTVNAADARTTLRVSAKLSRFECGFDATGTPNAINLIKNRSFAMNTSITDGHDKTDMTIVVRGDDLCVLYNNNQSVSGGMGDMGGLGIVLLDGKFYCICETEDAKIALFIPEDMLNTLFDEDFSIEDIENLIYMAIPDDLGTPTKNVTDGTATYTYSYVSNGEQFTLKTNAFGVPTSIVSNGAEFASLEITSITGTNIDSYFDLSDYTIL